jgi:4-alpha-glucanotransferase
MRLPRGSGILLHPTSLPGPYGIGDLGPAADAFIAFLARTGQRWWQILPVGPTGYGNSPYQSHSSYAGNTLLISPELMVEGGFLQVADLETVPDFPVSHVDFDRVTEWKASLFRRAAESFNPDRDDYRAFEESSRHWLHDYALYMAVKEAQGGRAWNDWDAAIAARKPEAMHEWSERLAGPIRYHKFTQFLFDTQWRRFRRNCRDVNVGLIGDLPIFVSQDSSDVWAHPELFMLDHHGRPTVVAGVPPDYFSATGQLWGNPLSRWDAHQADGFAWWVARMRATTDRVDLVRLDHFRGFEAYWEVPADAPTAASGRWAQGPGAGFLDALRWALGGLPIVAEDLGAITPEVEALRDQFDLPGMKILQFAFGDSAGAEKYLPYAYPNHCLVYTGTHDNDTTLGWFQSDVENQAQTREQIERTRAFIRRFVGQEEPVHWGLIRSAISSVADTAIAPMQDILSLGSEARMNVPGKASGNWGWRFTASQFPEAAANRLADLTATYGRWNGPGIPEPFRTTRDWS